MFKFSKIRGFGVVEVLVAAAIISATIFSLFSVFILANRLSGEAGDKIRANFLAEEGLEAMRYLRDKSWSTNLFGLVVGMNYYLTFNSGTSRWSVGTSNPGAIDGTFTRAVTIGNVSRDSNDNIVSSGGTNDPNTKKINVQISWVERGAALNIILSTYLADIFKN